MRSLMLGIVIAAASLSVAGAQEAKSVDVAAKDAAVQAQANQSQARKVYVCDSRDLTRRSFTREYGAMQFVTADQAAHSQAAWTAPKCMRSSELMRLKRQQLASR
jgi:hypothetical protein